MEITKNILRAINEGLLQALTFDKDELESSEEFNMQTTSSKNNIDISKKSLEKKYYSLKLQEMMPDAYSSVVDVSLLVEKLIDIFITNAIEWYEKYGATYNPHLNNIKFPTFVSRIVEIHGNDSNLNWIDTSDITDMSYIFYNKQFNGDISEWNVSNVTGMTGMFSSCCFNGDISKWDTSNVEDMGYMFNNAEKFNLNISKWDISKVKNMDNMFYDARSFELDLSNWTINIRKTFIIDMFHKCPIEDTDKMPHIIKCHI